ncbi:MAG TPA: ATP synthase F1 subunit delta [Terriglobales bacterium]|nr:ATP synthase F1 subunit delta [Terriglobales bacterium]
MAAVNSRYARAFAEVVLEQKLDPGTTVEQVRMLAELFAASSELRAVWENPAVPAGQKQAVLDAIGKRAGVSRQVRNFVAVLIDRGRIPALPQIARQFEAELDQALGFVEAEVSSARDLGDEEKRTLEAQIARVTGRKVRAHYRRDAGLLGGAVVKVGSTIYDGSVRGQLRRLKETLSD